MGGRTAGPGRGEVGGDDDSWLSLTLPIESLEHAHTELFRFGAEIEVLAPPALRERFARTAAELARRYDA